MRKILSIFLLLAIAGSAFAPVLPKPMLGLQPRWENPLTKGLVGFWLMNEGAGGTVFDLSGNGNNGTFATDPTWSPGKFGSALNFGGTAGVNLGSPLVAATGSFTALAWVYQKTNTYSSIISQYRADEGGRSIFIMWHTDGEFRAVINGGAADVSFSASLLTWYQIGITRNSAGGLVLYVNGVAVDTGSDAGGIEQDANTFIGSDATDTFPSTSIIDHAAIYNRALSTSEIAELYRNPFGRFRFNPGWAWYVPGGGPSGTGYIFNVGSTIFGGAVQ